MSVDKKIEQKGEAIKKELSEFVQHIHEKYGIGHGCLILEINEDVTMGTLFGNVRTFDADTERKLLDSAKRTIEGGAKEAQKQFDTKKEEIAEKVAQVVCDLLSLDEKKEKSYHIAVKEGIIVDNKVDCDKLADFVKRTNGNQDDYDGFKKVLEELCEEHENKDE